MSVLTDLIYGGSNAVAGLTEGAVNDAIAKYGADHPIAFPDTAYFFPTIYAATGVKVKTLGDLVPCVGVLKSLITNQEDLGQALNAGLATAVGAEILEGLKWVAISFALCVVPVFITAFIAKRMFKMSYADNVGMLCGGMANPFALDYAGPTSEGEDPAVSYATVYPVSIFLRVITAQVLIILLS